MLPCQREQNCLNCLHSGREPHPLLSLSKPTAFHTKVWSGQNKLTNTNPCSKSTSFLLVFLSQVPSTRPQKHPARCQHKVCASAKQQTRETWGGLGWAGGTLTGAMPCTEICKTNYCINKPSQTKYKFPPKHPSKALSIIKIIKTSIF